MARFGELLKRYRNRAGLTQQQLGNRLRLSSPYIAQIESGIKPPPPTDIVERKVHALRLSEQESEEFLDLARVERGRQSLAKATRKLGYTLSGNDVLVSEIAISRAIREELNDIFEEARSQSVRGMFVGGLDRTQIVSLGNDAPILRSCDEMIAWLLDYLGGESQTGLVFLSLLYGELQLADSDHLLCRNPSPLRDTIEKEQGDPGLLVARLKSTIDKAREGPSERRPPDVIPIGEAPADQTPSSDQAAANRHIPIIGVVEPGSDAVVACEHRDPVEIPRSWLDEGAEYQAIEVQSVAFEGFGIWPGTKILFELDAESEADDIVVVQMRDHMTIMTVKMRMAKEGTLILQGGGRSAPVVYVNREDEATILGVVRQFVSSFRDMKRVRRYSAREN